MEVLWTKLCPSNSYAETLTLNVMIVFRDRAFKGAIKVKGVHKGGAFYEEKKRQQRAISQGAHTGQSPCEHSERRQRSVSQKESSHQ